MDYTKPYTSEHTPPQPQPETGSRFTYPGGMEGWVDLVGAEHRLGQLASSSVALLVVTMLQGIHSVDMLRYSSSKHVLTCLSEWPAVPFAAYDCPLYIMLASVSMHAGSDLCESGYIVVHHSGLSVSLTEIATFTEM